MENNNLKNKKQIKRGDIYFINLGQGYGSEQGGRRPCVVIQNNTGNKFSPTVIVAIITSKMSKRKLPTHVNIDTSCGLKVESCILLEQIQVIDKKRLNNRVGSLSDEDIKRVDKALKISLGL